jgi:hypothetical protein
MIAALIAHLSPADTADEKRRGTMEVKVTRSEREILDRMKAGWEPMPMQIGMRLYRSLINKGLATVEWDSSDRAVMRLATEARP